MHCVCCAENSASDGEEVPDELDDFFTSGSLLPIVDIKPKVEVDDKSELAVDDSASNSARSE